MVGPLRAARAGLVRSQRPRRERKIETGGVKRKIFPPPRGRKGRTTTNNQKRTDHLSSKAANFICYRQPNVALTATPLAFWSAAPRLLRRGRFAVPPRAACDRIWRARLPPSCIDAPSSKRTGVNRLPGIVLGKPFPEVLGEPDVEAIRVFAALQHINVREFHLVAGVPSRSLEIRITLTTVRLRLLW